MIASIDLAKEPTRAKFLPRDYLFATAEGFRRTAERLTRDADNASDEQAQLMRRHARLLNEAADSFDEQATTTPAEEYDLPFR